VTIVTGLSVGIAPEATALSSLSSTPSPRRVAVATNCLAKALHVPELLPVHQLDSLPKVHGLTVKDTEIHLSSSSIDMFIPVNFLVVCFLCANTDNCIDISALSC
jgi:hypothetical protein